MCIIDREFPHIPIASTGFAVLTCHANLLNKYLFYYLMSPDFDAYANNTDNAKGVAYPAINDDRLYKALIPIPPVAEQHRIVSAIDSVNIPLCEYGSKEETLRILNTSFPENLKKSILKRQSKASWRHKSRLTSLQRLCWSVFGRRSSGSSRKEKSRRTSMNPSFSDGIILIMRSWTELSIVLTMSCHLIYRNRGYGFG